MEKQSGLLILDKPLGLTSRAAVDRAQKWFPPGTRLGHTGTLDPLATGVLVLCAGVATRLSEYIQDMDKVYRAGICFGAASTTDDAEGALTPIASFTTPDEAAVRQALATFVGDIDQVPPNFSAAKLSGRRAYDLARKGQEVSLAARKVHIYAIDLLRYEFPRLELEVRCGKGTYIRSLARDLGARLGCGGYIASLRRLRVGPFTTDEAVPLEAAADQVHLLPLALALSELPAIHLAVDQVRRLRHGQTIPWGGPCQPGDVAAFTGLKLAGIVRYGEGHLRVVRILQ